MSTIECSSSPSAEDRSVRKAASCNGEQPEWAGCRYGVNQLPDGPPAVRTRAPSHPGPHTESGMAAHGQHEAAEGTPKRGQKRRRSFRLGFLHPCWRSQPSCSEDGQAAPARGAEAHGQQPAPACRPPSEPPARLKLPEPTGHLTAMPRAIPSRNHPIL